MKNPYQRIAVLVDVQNLYHSAKNLYQANVNFGQVLKLATQNRQLIRAIAYLIRAEVPKEQTFFDAMVKSGYEIRMKDLQTFAGGVKKGDWDIGIAMDAIKIADRMDAIILITGDGDFAPLVSYLKENKGCRVEVIAFGRSASQKLIEVADEFVDLDTNPKPFLIHVGQK
jgi:uncharacterized LabA/DUF88 family protein